MIHFLKRIFSPGNLFHIFGAIGLISLLLAYLSPLIHPETFGALSFFGLAYPLIIAFNLLLLLVFILAKRKWWLVIGAVLLLGMKFHLRVYAIGSDKQITSDYSIKVLSYNVQLFGRYDSNPTNGHKTKHAIFNYLARAKADIYCFQEFYHQDLPSNFVTRDTLMHLLSIADKHERYRSHEKSRQNYGVSILSKYPFLRKGNVNFENAEMSNNFCVYGDFAVKGDTFRLYNVHLQSIHFQKDDYAAFEDTLNSLQRQSQGIIRALRKVNDAFPIRARQAEKVSEHIRHSPYPVIVCGDFNDTPVSYSYHQFSALLTDAFRNCSSGLGITYAGKIPAGRIDYIFHDQSLESTNFVIQKERLSDHYAISCTIFPKPK